MVIVVILGGKSDSDAHKVSVKLFDNIVNAEQYCEETTDMESKYWTKCSIVSDGEEIETYRDY
jgi:hypothetical protein